MHKKVTVILIVSILIISGFAASILGMNNIKNSAQDVAKTNYANTEAAGQEIQSYSNTSNAGYVKYTLVLINNTLLKGNVPYGNGIAPCALAYDSANGYIYVANGGSNTVSVINGATNTVIDNITVGNRPYAIAYDPANGYVYVANRGSNTVSVINGATNTVIDNITVGYGPNALAYDPAKGYVYVANWDSGTISIIFTSSILLYTVTFTENGLPTGAPWSVMLNGKAFNGQYINTTLNSRTNTITFYEPNGTYSYIVHIPSGYHGNNLNGTISVSGTTLKIQIKAQGPINYMLLIVISVVVVIVILGVLVGLRWRKPKSKGPKEWKPEEKK